MLTAVYAMVAGASGEGVAAMVSGYSAVFAVGAGVFVAAAVVAWLLIEGTPRTAGHDAARMADVVAR